MIIGISGKIGNGKDTVGKIIQYIIERRELCKKANRNKNLTKKEFEEIAEPCEEDFLDYDHDYKYCDYEIKKFAGKLKQIVSILTGIPVEDLEKQEVKNRVLGEEWWYVIINNKKLTKNVTDLFKYNENAIIKPTVRQLLQEIGTEAMRDVIHPNCWVNALFADYKKYKYAEAANGIMTDKSMYKYSNWIITDVRFPNELQAVKNRDGISIRVNRSFVKNCNYCGKTIRQQMKGCNEITCYRQNLKTIEHFSETALDNHKFDYTIDNNGSIEELIEKVKQLLIKEKII